MQVPVAVAQIPVRWSVPGNLEAILAALGTVDEGALLVLPECALSGAGRGADAGAGVGGRLRDH